MSNLVTGGAGSFAFLADASGAASCCFFFLLVLWAGMVGGLELYVTFLGFIRSSRMRISRSFSDLSFVFTDGLLKCFI